MSQTGIPHLLLKGRDLESQKRYDEALAVYDSILKDVPVAEKVLRRRCWVLRHLGRYQEALAGLDRLLTLTPDDPWAATQRADVLRLLGRLAEADEAASHAVELAPRYAFAHLSKSNVSGCLERDDESLYHATQALDLDPKNLEAAEQRANALYRLKRFDEAVPAYERASQLNPTAASLRYWKGYALSELGRNADALSAFDEALSLAPSDPESWRTKGITLTRMGRYDEALTALERAIELAPDDPWSIAGSASAQFHLSRYREAAALYERALTTSLADDSTRAQLWLNLAYTRRRLEEFGGGLEAVEQTLALAPGLARAWAEKALLLVKLGHYQEALAAAEHGKKLDPADATAAGFAVQALFHLGRYDEAKRAADQVIAMSPDHPHAQEWQVFLSGLLHRRTPDKSFTLSDGRRLEYIELGDPDGFPVIACHGTPGSRLDWDGHDDILRELRIRLIAPDRPGYGLSTFKRNMSLSDWAKDVQELADHLRIIRFAVLGVSGGGPYAIACAVTLRERVAALALVSSGGFASFPLDFANLPRMNRWAMYKARHLPWPVCLAASQIDTLFVRAAPSVWSWAMTSTPEEARLSGPTRLAPIPRARVLEPYRQGGRGCAWEAKITARHWGFNLTDVSTPTFVWHGERDHLVPISVGRYLADHIPNCRATFYENEGHFLMEKHFREILTTLAEAARRALVTGHDRL